LAAGFSLTRDGGGGRRRAKFFNSLFSRCFV
jgi:hypothetical protein